MAGVPIRTSADRLDQRGGGGGNRTHVHGRDGKVSPSSACAQSHPAPLHRLVGPGQHSFGVPRGRRARSATEQSLLMRLSLRRRLRRGRRWVVRKTRQRVRDQYQMSQVLIVPGDLRGQPESSACFLPRRGRPCRSLVAPVRVRTQDIRRVERYLRAFISRSISRRTSLVAIASRLSRPSRPRASAISTFARPSLK